MHLLPIGKIIMKMILIFDLSNQCKIDRYGFAENEIEKFILI
jgi:hypothetical protein